ncbi:hypothetical protein LX64_01461 [Chitinophaga skermanii]|uniref:Uncharacterized protein n=1 Tax=Chitinophaga skermanii TaxID=331697 RepID=A0A327R4K2_9BACT|nr:hypothetical protein [Chitinophaga skermanii]RAJ08807.1 hypothetical protein LX64_01461 [Chitinophaga skermanii]
MSTPSYHTYYADFAAFLHQQNLPHIASIHNATITFPAKKNALWKTRLMVALMILFPLGLTVADFITRNIPNENYLFLVIFEYLLWREYQRLQRSYFVITIDVEKKFISFIRPQPIQPLDKETANIIHFENIQSVQVATKKKPWGDTAYRVEIFGTAPKPLGTIYLDDEPYSEALAKHVLNIIQTNIES